MATTQTAMEEFSERSANLRLNISSGIALLLHGIERHDLRDKYLNTEPDKMGVGTFGEVIDALRTHNEMLNELNFELRDRDDNKAVE